MAGKTDAVLLDTGFTRADALRIVAMVLDSKKALKTIYISEADPDYYFGIEMLKQYLPEGTDGKTEGQLDGAHCESARRGPLAPNRPLKNRPSTRV